MRGPVLVGGIIRTYLFVFNGVSLALWLAVLVQAVGCVLAGMDGASTHRALLTPLMLAQTVSAGDVVHAVLGFTATRVLPAGLQLLSRLVVVFALAAYMQASGHRCFVLLAVAWSVADVVRLAYYLTSPLRDTPVGLAIKSARYTWFIALYPVGFACELFMAWRAWRAFSPILSGPLLAMMAVWPVGMRMQSHPLGFVFMYRHMLGQRRRQLPSPKPSL